MRLMRDVCRRGAAGVVVTHGAQLASWADRVVFLRDERVVDQTAPDGPESLLAGGWAGGHERPSQIGAPGRRAVLRWTWRLFRRKWRQQLLVLILVTVGVAAAVAGSAMAVNADADPDAEFGTAGAHPNRRFRPAACARRSRPPREQVGTVDAIWITAADVPGVAEPIELRAQDPQGPFGQPMLASSTAATRRRRMRSR